MSALHIRIARHLQAEAAPPDPHGRKALSMSVRSFLSHFFIDDSNLKPSRRHLQRSVHAVQLAEGAQDDPLGGREARLPVRAVSDDLRTEDGPADPRAEATHIRRAHQV